MTINTQEEFSFFEEVRTRYKGLEEVINWDLVTGPDLAGNPVLMNRWLASPKAEEMTRNMIKWADQMNRRRTGRKVEK